MQFTAVDRRLHLLALSCVAWWLTPTFAPPASGETGASWDVLRREMTEREISGAGIRDARVVQAILMTPRHLFVPAAQRHLAYLDMALPIGEGQTISPPFIVAYMTEQLDVRPTDKVLEIGTGSGYQAAVLSPLAAEVYSIEIVEPLARRAASVLKTLAYSNVKTKIGDGFAGWPEFAPFQRIVVTCSPENVPPALVEQLSEGGRLVIPVGERFQQSLSLFVKREGKLERQVLEPTFFVPMTGMAEERRTTTNDLPITALVNGDFEALNERGEPEGWYYVRQAQAALEESSPSGARCLHLTNRQRGRHAQALQAIGVDGRRVATLSVQFSLRVRNVEAGQNSRQLPQLRISFFDENRAEAGGRQFGPWKGTITWAEQQATIEVPEKTRLAVLMLGMYGAVGEVDFDALSIEARTK